MPRLLGENVRRSATAFHEAGHSLAAIREGRRIGHVSVSRRNPGSGYVHFMEDVQRQCPHDPTLGPGSAVAAWQHSLAVSLSDIRILLTGPLAEAKALGQSMRVAHAHADFRECHAIAGHLDARWDALAEYTALPGFRVADVLNEQRAHVRRWLGRPKAWTVIQRIANALEHRAVLDKTDVTRELLAVYSPPAQKDLMFYDFIPRGPYHNSQSHSRGISASRSVGA